MVETSGLEPPTFRLSGECSNQLSYVSIMAGTIGLEPILCATKKRCITIMLRSITIMIYGTP